MFFDLGIEDAFALSPGPKISIFAGTERSRPRETAHSAAHQLLVHRYVGDLKTIARCFDLRKDGRFVPVRDLAN